MDGINLIEKYVNKVVSLTVLHTHKNYLYYGIYKIIIYLHLVRKKAAN